jgi:hypothetical protein
VIRQDYDQAGCAHGCRDTLATGLLFVLFLLALVWRGRRRG